MRDEKLHRKTVCWVHGHDWTVWQTYQNPDLRERSCTRCAKFQLQKRVIRWVKP